MSVGVAVHTASTSEWNGGEHFGGPGDVYYHVMRGQVTGTSPGDQVKVWIKPIGTAPAPESLIEEMAKEVHVAITGVGM